MKKLARFVVAGGLGFAVDAGVTLGFLALTPLGPFIARLLAMTMALGFTWYINRTFTFGRSHRPLVEEGFLYGFIGIVSALVNYGIYALLLLRNPMIQPIFALVIASLAAMALSFFGYSRFVFRSKD